MKKQISVWENVTTSMKDHRFNIYKELKNQQEMVECSIKMDNEMSR